MSRTLRLATASDLDGMKRVRYAVRENRLLHLRIADTEWIESIEVSGRGWVAEVAGEVVGFAIGNARTGNIWALFVDPGHEGCGRGRALHDAMVQWLWSTGLTRLWLSTDPHTRARTFYARAGWQQGELLPSGEVLLYRLPD